MKSSNNKDRQNKGPKKTREDESKIEIIREPAAGNKETSPEDGAIAPRSMSLPSTLPLLVLRNRPLFPRIMVPLTIQREQVKSMVQDIVKNNRMLGLVLSRQSDEPSDGHADAVNDPDEELHRVGVVAEISQIAQPSPQTPTQILVGVIERFEIVRFVQRKPNPVAEVVYRPDPEVEISEELKAYAVSIIQEIKELVKLNPMFKEELSMFLSRSNLNEPGRLADFAASMTTATAAELQDVLESFEIDQRIAKTVLLLKKEVSLSKVQAKINKQIEEKISKQQREFFLREQLKAIKTELGLSKEGKEAEIEKYTKRLAEINPTQEARARIEEQLDKLKLIEPHSPEYAVTHNYVDWLTSLPWGVYTRDNFKLQQARRVLNADHYGLQDVKQRILEFLSVGILKERISGSIICFVGPPGVGKTSLGHSIARCVGRKFYRFSLGGMQDEAEIKGHRRTYIGAMPGKFIQAIKHCESANPLIMLDEVDKIGASFRGDPASALLEVLDPEQNRDFLDHYIDVRFDLSNVLFLCTANQLDTIPSPLMDRMEIIHLAGYIREEKMHIAQDHLIPKQRKDHGLTSRQIQIPPPALNDIIDGYAREPGVRSLENNIRKIMRKSAMTIVQKPESRIRLRKIDVHGYLGKRIYSDKDPFSRRMIGVVTGLAWTSHGGEVLHVEATRVRGKKAGFKQTGQLGKVMVESTEIAYTFVRAFLDHEAKYREFFENALIHLHVPAGATPKDGPSAGITMACALYSLATRAPLRIRCAMSGELSLTGLVMPVGGLKEKTIAAKRGNITTLIFPAENREDFEELPAHIRKGLKPVFVSRFRDVVAACF